MFFDCEIHKIRFVYVFQSEMNKNPFSFFNLGMRKINFVFVLQSEIINFCLFFPIGNDHESSVWIVFQWEKAKSCFHCLFFNRERERSRFFVCFSIGYGPHSVLFVILSEIWKIQKIWFETNAKLARCRFCFSLNGKRARSRFSFACFSIGSEQNIVFWFVCNRNG